jgi:hypothetical protein
VKRFLHRLAHLLRLDFGDYCVRIQKFNAELGWRCRTCGAVRRIDFAGKPYVVMHPDTDWRPVFPKQ